MHRSRRRTCATPADLDASSRGNAPTVSDTRPLQPLRGRGPRLASALAFAAASFLRPLDGLPLNTAPPAPATTPSVSHEAVPSAATNVTAAPASRALAGCFYCGALLRAPAPGRDGSCWRCLSPLHGGLPA